jgi:beta propeller repeat protein
VAPALALEESGVAGLRGEIRSPLPGDTVGGDADAGLVTGSVGGVDFAGFALEIGKGDAPDAWTPIRSERRPVEGAALGEIPLGALSDGAYVLRLRLAGSVGASVVEFAPIGIERNRPIPVSAGERDARNPAIDALRVVWDAEVPDPEAEGSVRQLAHARFGQPSERLLAPGGGDQHQASLSAGAVAWLEGSPESEPGETEVFVCFLRGASRCVPMRASGGPTPREQLQISRGNLVVLEQRERAPVLSGCRLDRSGCALREIATGLSFNPEFPVLDASRLVFGISAIPGGLYTCVLTPDTGSCPAEPVQLENTFFPRALALSGRTLVFAGGRQPGGPGVFVCSLGEGAECEGARVASLPATYEVRADASGRRVVWDAPGAHGEPDVYFCELDPESRTCPAQRITSDAAAQRNPHIDGTRIVWEDGRSGGQAIAGFELPTIVASPSPRFGEGRWGSLEVRVRGTREAVLSATSRNGEAIHLEQRSPTAAVLRWRPGPGDAGVHRVSLRATLPSGLFTEREIAITVVPK